jgi:Flp pilus assembly protein TadD
MSQAMKEKQPEESDQKLAEFARRVVNGEKAVDVFDLDDGFIDGVLHRAHQFYAAGQYDEAAVLLRGAAVLDSGRMYPRLLLGDILLRDNAFEEAVEHLGRAHEVDPDNAVVMSKLGEAYLRLGQEERAMELLSRAVDALEEDTPHHRRATTMLSVCEGRRRAAADT